MIEPVTQGRALIRQLATPLPAGCAMGVWRLGQAGFVVRWPSATVVIDLYLSNHCEAMLARPFDHRRLSRAPLDPAELTMVDVAICSHDHLDHLDVPTMRTIGTASPGAVALLPDSARATLIELDWAPRRVVGTRDGEVRAVAGVRVESFAVAHDKRDLDPRAGHRYQGYLLEADGIRVAHVGDAVVDAPLRELLRDRRVDVLMVPINGRDEQRAALGFAGNMGAEEAAQLAQEVGAGMVVPMHYDMFAQNVDADALGRFDRECTARGVRHVVLELGAALLLDQDGRPPGHRP